MKVSHGHPLFAVLLIGLLACGGDGGISDPIGQPPPPPPPSELPGRWTSRAPMPTARGEMVSVALGGKIYVPGGLDPAGSALAVMEIYDPASNTWSTGPAMPEPRHHFGAAAANGKLYVFGGYVPGSFPWTASDKVFEYDPRANMWTQKRSMSDIRAALVAVTVNDRVYVIGGERRQVTSRRMEVYDPASDAWSEGASMPSSREHLAAAVIGNTIYVVGGRRTGNFYDFWRTTENLSTLEAFSTASNSWRTLRPMSTARGGLAAAALNGRLYVFGGEHPGVFAETEEYNPDTDTWRRMKDIPSPRHGFSAAVVGGSAFLIGGGLARGVVDADQNEMFVPE